MEWPARSPDLNIIENVWGLLAGDVYANAKQFDSVNQLREAIEAAWNRLSVEQIKKLCKLSFTYDSCYLKAWRYYALLISCFLYCYLILIEIFKIILVERKFVPIFMKHPFFHFFINKIIFLC